MAHTFRLCSYKQRTLRCQTLSANLFQLIYLEVLCPNKKGYFFS